MTDTSKDHGGCVKVGDVWGAINGVVLVVQEVTPEWVYHRFFKSGKWIDSMFPTDGFNDMTLLHREPEREKWISVEDRFPDNEDFVLVAYKVDPDIDLSVATDFYLAGLESWDSSPIVTHWQPLPEPPNCGHKVSEAETKTKGDKS